MTYLGPLTHYPASERCPELRQPEVQRKPEAHNFTRTNIVIWRKPGMTENDWHNYHCAELSRLRQERNRRGDVMPLNRGKVEVGRVVIQRG